MSLKKLIDKAKEFSLSQDYIDSKEQGRVSFISKFPFESLSDLTVEQYAQGTSKDSFCYWLEFRDILFGIGGGSAAKFGIYKGQDGKYYSGSGKNKRELSSEELSEEFSIIKDSVVKALKFTENEEIERIKELKTPVWNMVLQKILSLYFPDKFLTIGAADVLIECARDIGVDNVKLSSENSIEINYWCKKKLSNQDTFKNWGYERMGSFIWQTYLGESKRDYYILGSKYGENADEDVFPEMLKRSVIATGFAYKHDLTEYQHSNHSEITSFLKEKGEEKKSYNALKYFLNLKSGDKVAIKADGSPKGKKGFLSIVGIAEVREKEGKVYEYDPEGLGHIIHVNFLKAPVYKEFSFGGYGRTIHKLSQQEHIDAIFKSDYDYSFRLERFKKWLQPDYKQQNGTRLSDKDVSNYLDGIKQINEEVKDINLLVQDSLFAINKVSILEELRTSYFSIPSVLEKDKIRKNMYLNSFDRYIEFMEQEGFGDEKKTMAKTPQIKMPLNTIFYGPPGTGKTYTTIFRAAEIVEKEHMRSYDDAKKVFNRHIDNQIQFITFHQNYSYEDFIQGLRPDLKEGGNLRFNRKDGVFTKVAVNALFEYYKVLKKKSSKNTIVKKNADESEIYLDFVEYLKNRESKEFNTSTGSTIYIDDFTKNDNISFKHQNKSRSYLVSGKRLLKLFAVYPDINQITSLHNNIRDAIGGCNTTVYWVALREFIDFYNSYYSSHTNDEPEEENYDDVGYETKKKLLGTVDLEDLRTVSTSEVPNYVLIIDEINRANISRVFGELITLIEPDKRSHGNIPLSSILPSGEEQFIVPSNLYLIGTMNTADKSISLLDIALRRRFEFEAMYPKPDLIGVYEPELLEKINEKIRALKGYDFQIGHAYFMGEDFNLTDTMNKRVIPLLMEYFMNDEREVREILKVTGLNVKENSWPLKVEEAN